MQAAVPDLEVQKAPVIIQLHLPLLELCYHFFLFVALAPDLHAADTDVANLLFERLELRLLQTLELLLVRLLFERDQLLLHFEHVKAVGGEEVPLVLLQDLLQLRVQLEHLCVDLPLQPIDLGLVVNLYNEHYEGNHLQVPS